MPDRPGSRFPGQPARFSRMGTLLTLLTMFGWVPLTVGLFLVMPPKRAVLWAFFLSWLFLPMAKYELPMLPDFTKMTAACYGVLLGVVLFDTGRLMQFRPSFWDIPIFTLTIVAPIASSISNGLHQVIIYDPLSSALGLFTAWALPYFAGRLYFKTLDDMKTLGIALVFAGFAYIPIILFETRFSPQLHRWIYGFHQHDFVHAARQGGFRPRGFMQSGLMVSLWMGACTVTLFCMWLGGVKLSLMKFRVPMGVMFFVMLATTVLCKGVGALALTMLALGAILLSFLVRTRIFVIAMIVIAPLYVSMRLSGAVTGESLVTFVEQIDEERASSLKFRLDNENLLMVKALTRGVLGWGGWGRNYVYNELGKRVAVVDGMWILLLGRNGAVGLIAWMLALAVPTLLFMWRFPPGMWLTPSLAPLTGMATVLAMYQLDCLPNGMENPVFFLLAGAMTSYLSSTEALEWRRLRGLNGPRTGAGAGTVPAHPPGGPAEPQPVGTPDATGERPAAAPLPPGLEPAYAAAGGGRLAPQARAAVSLVDRSRFAVEGEGDVEGGSAR